MATHLIVRVCAMAVTIGICSISSFAEPISMSAKLNSVSTLGLRSQHDSASLSVKAISLSGANKQSQTSPTSFSMSANMLGSPTIGLEKVGTPLNVVTVPEPTTMLLFGSGLLAALGYRAKRRTGKSV